MTKLSQLFFSARIRFDFDSNYVTVLQLLLLAQLHFTRHLDERPVLEKIAGAFNQELSLPYDVSISFKDCGQPNAFYTAQSKTITMCYEFMELFYNIFAKKGNLVWDRKESDYASVMAGIVVFKTLAENEESSAGVFADEHSLSSQRYYNLACWMYGSDPQTFSFLIQQGFLPEARAARCSDEYEKMSRAWQRLVDPWIKR